MNHMKGLAGVALVLFTAAQGTLGQQNAPERHQAQGPTAAKRPEPSGENGPPALAHLQNGSVPVGVLGQALGTYLTVEGQRGQGGKGVGFALLVDSVNGKRLKEPVGIALDNLTRALPKGVRITLRGYETGQMIGVAPAVVSWQLEKGETVLEPQAVWQWHSSFVILSAVKSRIEFREPRDFKTLKQVQEREPGRR